MGNKASRNSRWIARSAGIALALWCVPAAVFAQEKQTLSAGVLVEANANTRRGYGLAGGLMGDYGFTDRLAAGLKVDAGSDFYDVSSFEALAFVRYYLLRFKTPAPLFVQAGAGLITLFEDGRSVSSVLADASVGVRFPFNRFYAEPYIRGGWPTGFGFGLVVGYRFDLKKDPDTRPAQPKEQELELAFGDDFIRQADGSILYMPAIFFRANFADFGTHGLPPGIIENNMAILDHVASFLKKHQDYTAEITGYANPVLGSAWEEREKLVPLSLDRANFIRAELVKRGIDPSRLTTKGAGGQGADPNNLINNRRAQFIFRKTK